MYKHVSLNDKYNAIIATHCIIKMDCLQWNCILENVNLLSCRFIYSFQIPLTCSQNSVIIIVTRLPAVKSGFEYWQGLIKYTSDLWNDIWKHYVYMMISLCAQYLRYVVVWLIN